MADRPISEVVGNPKPAESYPWDPNPLNDPDHRAPKGRRPDVEDQRLQLLRSFKRALKQWRERILPVSKLFIRDASEFQKLTDAEVREHIWKLSVGVDLFMLHQATSNAEILDIRKVINDGRLKGFLMECVDNRVMTFANDMMTDNVRLMREAKERYETNIAREKELTDRIDRLEQLLEEFNRKAA